MAAHRRGSDRPMVVLFLLLIVMLGFACTTFSRGNLVLLMLLPASEFLGFVDPMKIAIKGVFDIHALLGLIILTAITVSIFKFNLLLDAKLKVPIFVFFTLWCYGVVYPWQMGHSSLFYSLKASKEFFTIFSFVAVLLFVKTESEIDLAWKYLVGFGVYYSIVEVAGQLTGPGLQEIMSYLMRREDKFLTKIYLPFWPLILIALFYYFYETSQNIEKRYLRMFICFIGLLLTFFRSYFIASLVVVPLLLILTGQGVFKTVQRATASLMVLCVSLILFSFTFGSGLETLDRVADKYLVSPILEVATHSGGSLLGRERVTESKRKLLMENAAFGYGFIDKESALGRKLLYKVGGHNLGFIDKGTIDVPIKFGYIGFGILLLVVASMIMSLLRMAQSYDNKVFYARCMTMATILVVSIAVLPVHAPFTYSYSLLPFGIALGLIEKQRSMLESGKATVC